MKTLAYKFSESEIRALENYRDNQKDVRLLLRILALLMLAKGSSVQDASKFVGKTEKTIENWFQQYRTEGLSSLNSFKYKPKRPYLSIHQIYQVIIWVTYEHPENTKQIREYIIDKFGVKYCIEAVRQLLRKYGLKVLRPKIRPGNTPTVEEQKQFVEKYNEIKTSSAPGSVVLFGDGMHLIHQNIPGLCWGDPLYPPVLETNSGRKRLNILGAYNPETLSLIHHTGEENCDAERAIEYCDLILREYPTAPQISLILDNARYFHAKIVSEWLENHPRLHIEFLPPYAPNLNLIERLWGFVKNKLVKNKYYKEYKTFRAKVFQFLNNIGEYADELKTLMTENFEIICA
jgi:transposase